MVRPLAGCCAPSPKTQRRPWRLRVYFEDSGRMTARVSEWTDRAIGAHSKSWTGDGTSGHGIKRTGLAGAGGCATEPERSRRARGSPFGSDAAQQRLGTLAPAVAGQIERIVNGAFMDGLHAAMTLSIAVAVLGVASALLLRGNAAPAKR